MNEKRHEPSVRADEGKQGLSRRRFLPSQGDFGKIPRFFQEALIYNQPGSGGYQEADAVRHGLRIEGAGCAEGEGQQAGGGKIEAFPEERQGKGKPGQSQSGQGIHEGVLEA